MSAKRRNFGRTILENIIGSGFDKYRIVILRDGEPDPSGVRCVPDLRSVGEPLDLFIVAVGAEHVPGLVDEVLETGAARSVMLIPGGPGNYDTWFIPAEKL